jgi:nucleoside phosphorylase
MDSTLIISAGNGEVFDFATPMGVGLGEIAINLTRAVLYSRPERIIFVGTAGSYGRVPILDVVESNTSSQVELSFLEKKSYTPIDNLLSSGEAGGTVVNSSNYITTDFELSKRFLKLNIDIENMEFFSVLQVAKEFDIPVRGLFVVTNYTDSEAHENYRKNLPTAMRIINDRFRGVKV